jgi:hypothetical protein
VRILDAPGNSGVGLTSPPTTKPGGLKLPALNAAHLTRPWGRRRKGEGGAILWTVPGSTPKHLAITRTLGQPKPGASTLGQDLYG